MYLFFRSASTAITREASTLAEGLKVCQETAEETDRDPPRIEARRKKSKTAQTAKLS